MLQRIHGDSLLLQGHNPARRADADATNTPWLAIAPPRCTFSYRASITRYGYAGDRAYLARRYALDIHLQHGQHTCLLAALVAFEHLGLELSVAVLGGPSIPVSPPASSTCAACSRCASRTAHRCADRSRRQESSSSRLQSHAANCRPLRKLRASPTEAIIALAVIEPTPAIAASL